MALTTQAVISAISSDPAGVGTAAIYDALAAAEIVYAACQDLADAVMAARPPIIEFIVPGPTSIAVLAAQRYGSDAIMCAAHTYTGNGAGQSTPGTFTVAVLDDGRVVTKAGAQLSIALTAPALEQVALQLSTPNGKTKKWSGLGTGAITNQAFQLAAPELAGATCGGAWTLTATGAATLVSWSLFAEGVGPGGLAGDLFEWGVYLDPEHLGENGFTPDLRAVVSAMARIQHAHADGHIIRALAAAPDTSLAIPDQFLPA
jgi:hypothetical protein